MEENNFWFGIADTPWWIYGLFAYFLFIGYIATKPRIIHFRQLIGATAMLSGFSFFNFIFFVHPNQVYLGIWAFCFLSAGLCGFLQFRIAKIKAFKNESKISLPGTYTILALALFGIASKYYTHFQLDLNPAMLNQPLTLQLLSGFYGSLTGYFAGKTYYAWRCIKRGPYVPA